MKEETKKGANWEDRMRLRNWRCFYWTAAWVVSMAVATFGPRFLWSSLALTVLAIAANLALGVGLILAYIKWLQDLDEMHQRIHLEALAFALGVGVVGGLSYSLLDQTNVIARDAEISFVVILVSVTYLCGITVGNLRYK